MEHFVACHIVINPMLLHNRAKGQIMSLHGSSTYVQARYNTRDPVTQRFPSLIDTYRDMHTKSGEWTHENARLAHARSHLKDDNYLSSVFTFMLPSSESVSKRHEDHLKPARSLPTRWKSGSISWKHEPLNTYDESDDESDPHEQRGQQSRLKGIKYDNIEISNTREDNGDQGSGRSTSSSSEGFEDATEPNTPMRAVIDLTLDSFFIFPELYQFFQPSLPNIVKGCRWVLLYSTLRHGISLRTLIRKSSDLSGPCLLITGDPQGAIFGGLLNCPLTPTPKRKYQGTYETFVFTTLYGAPRLFRPTGANRYFYMCLNDMLALGGGGNFAICLDGDLLNGTSGRCDTFGNQCLAHDESFELKNVEEMNLLEEADQPGNQLDDYMTKLNTIQSQKAAVILELQNRLAHFQKCQGA